MLLWTLNSKTRATWFSAEQDGVDYFVGTKHGKIVLIIREPSGTSVEDVQNETIGMEVAEIYAKAYAIICRIKPLTWRDGFTLSHCELNRGGIADYFAWKNGGWQVHWHNGKNDSGSVAEGSLEHAKKQCEQHFRTTVKNFLLSLDLSLTPV